MIDPENKIGEYEKVIAAAAYKFRKAAEYDDLYQEGMIAVWLSPPDMDPKYINSIIFNRMKDWVRLVKRQRHFQTADYAEIMEGEKDDDDAIHDGDS
jgi:DNA-directed RNA polymerase specialized sigma24 family protein